MQLNIISFVIIMEDDSHSSIICKFSNKNSKIDGIRHFFRFTVSCE